MTARNLSSADFRELGRRHASAASSSRRSGPRVIARPAASRDACGMNATERDYSSFLAAQRLTGAILDFRYEALSLRLADPANASSKPNGKKTAVRYTPDFLVICGDRIELHEIKGHMEDDALVKIKVAATLYPWFIFRVVYRDRSGGWTTTTINPE